MRKRGEVLCTRSTWIALTPVVLLLTLGLVLPARSAIHPVGQALTDMGSGCSIAVTSQGAIMVEGLDRFLKTMKPVGYADDGQLVLVKDTKTGSLWAIKKVK